MIKGRIIIIALMSIIGFGFIIAIPIGVLSVNFSSYGTINKKLSFEYLPDESSAVEGLNLNVDFGNIEIKYIDTPINYFVKIDVNIEMAGKGLANKDYLDYFNIIEGNTTGSPIDFSMRFLSGIIESEVESLIRDISVIVTIQKGILFDISAMVLKGNVDLSVPFNVPINNINVNTTVGRISYELRNCIVEGNITGITNQGDVRLTTEDVQYTRNSVWYIKSIQDSIIFDIDQSLDMGANVTGYGESRDKFVKTFYYDDTDSVGAWLKLVDQDSGFPDDPDHYYNPDGWDWITNPNDWISPVYGYEFISSDFPAKNNYNISIYSHAGRHFFHWSLYNEP